MEYALNRIPYGIGRKFFLASTNAIDRRLGQFFFTDNVLAYWRLFMSDIQASSTSDCPLSDTANQSFSKVVYSVNSGYV